MTMKYEDILLTVYEDEFKAGYFSMAYDIEGNFLLTSWAVPNVPQPTNQEILALETPQIQHLFSCNQFFNSFLPVLNDYFRIVAQQRNYNSELSCISYFNSTNPQWKNESETYSEWRNSVWIYVLQQRQDIIDGIRPIPQDMQGLLSELPPMQWPN